MKKNRKNTPDFTTTSPAKPDATALRLTLKIPDFASRYNVRRRVVWEWLKVGMPHIKITAHNRVIPVQEGDRWVKEKFYCRRER